MATTRAEALSRHARTMRVTHVTGLPVHLEALDRDESPFWPHEVTRVSAVLRHAQRVVVLAFGIVAQTPFLTALFG